MNWFSITLISAFSLASSDALIKKYFSHYAPAELVMVRFVPPAIMLIPICFLYPIPETSDTFFGLLAILIPLEIAAMYLYVKAITSHPLHLTVPYFAFTPIFSIATGYIFLDETISLQGATGILLVFMGAYLLNVKDFTQRDVRYILEPLKAIVTNPGSRLVLLAAFLYSISAVLSKQAMGYVTPISFGPFYFVVIGLATLIFFSISKPLRLRVLFLKPIPLLALGGLMAIMLVTHFLAIAQIEVAYMVAVKRTSLLFGILYGAIIFKERHLAKNLAAGTLMLAGISIISLV